MTINMFLCKSNLFRETKEQYIHQKNKNILFLLKISINNENAVE